MAYGSKPPANRRSPSAKKTMNKKPATKIKKNLTERQKVQLKEHSVHHTTKHINKMKILMREGKSFKQSHAIAMKMIGS